MNDFLLLLDRMNTLDIELMNVCVELASLNAMSEDNKSIQAIYGKYALQAQKQIDKYESIVASFNREANNASTK